MRTRSGGSAEQRGGVVAVHAGRLGAGADHQRCRRRARRRRPRARCRRARRSRCGTRRATTWAAAASAARGVAAADPALDQAVAGAAGVDEGRSGRLGGGRVGERRQRRPRRRGSRRGRRGAPSSKATSATASPRKRASASASAGWSAKRGITPKRLRPGMSAAVRTARHLGARGRPGGEVAEAEGGARVRRADRLQDQAAGMPEVGAEGVAAVDLGRAVEPGEARADRAAGGRGSGGRVGDAGVEDGGDDLAVAGAAAEDAAEGVVDLGLARARPRGEERGRRHQHAGRADAALRRAVAEEGGLQRGRAAGRGEALDGGHPRGRRPGRPGSGRRRPGGRRGARCRRRSRRRRSRPWCR